MLSKSPLRLFSPLLLFLLLPHLSTAPAGASDGGRGGRAGREAGFMVPAPLVAQPHFDPNMHNHTTAVVGGRAELHCRVEYLGNRTVSWIRPRDVYILTVGRYSYTSDDRFEAVHQAGTNQWTLAISNVKLSDQGAYECHVSTTPLTTTTVYLEVKEPRLEILGAPDLYVQRSSKINLTCILTNPSTPDVDVMWLIKNETVSSVTRSRGGVAMIMDKGPNFASSHLLISHASVRDSGVYTCVPSDLLLHAFIQVHVLDGEEAVAMQMNNTYRPLPAHTERPPPGTPRVTSGSSSEALTVSERLVTIMTTVLLLLCSYVEVLG